MTILQNGMWFVIDCGIIVIVGLLIIWCLVKFTGKLRRSRSEILIEKAYEAVRDLEDYYDLNPFPDEQWERNRKILSNIAVNLAKLDREPIITKKE